MEGQMMWVLALAAPVILFPAAYVWYLTIGGIYTVIEGAQKRRAAKSAR